MKRGLSVCGIAHRGLLPLFCQLTIHEPCGSPDRLDPPLAYESRAVQREIHSRGMISGNLELRVLFRRAGDDNQSISART